jgi:hypothetical protein
MTKAIIEYIDRTDMAEWANGSDQPLGTIPLEYGQVLDTDFQPHHIAYVESDHLGVGGFYTQEQGFSAIFASIADCLANQADDALSEFVIPVSVEDGIFIHITIGDRPSEG